MQKGFTPIVIILIAASIALVVIEGVRNFSSNDKKVVIATPTNVTPSTIAPTETPIPSISPSVTASPKPTILNTPTPQANIIKPAPGAGYSSGTVKTEKGDFSANILSIDLTNTKVIIDTANDSDCGNGCATMSLLDFVSKNGGFAGVNGSYFCPASYPDCSGKTDSFDFPVYNTRLNHWINSGNLFWDGRSVFYVDGSGAHYLQNANSFSGSLTAGIVNYPGLIDNGNVQIDDNQSGLSEKQRAVGTKVGIGVIDTTKVLVVIAKNVNMQQFAYVFKALGAKGALNLDTGGSTALYYNGYKAGPGRNLPNAIIFANK